MRELLRLRALGLLALALGCGQGSAQDAGAADTAVADTAVADVPCVGPMGCGGRCERGNDFGVGRFCTPGGFQCRFPSPFCTVDADPTADPFCTRPCADDTQCGEGAQCRRRPGGMGPSGCFPLFCEGKARADGGASDAVSDAVSDAIGDGADR
ncbi:MAG: hypothetical protein HY909_17560 [Deltaproteobacteria bacterium]|nr:hypothetical protein [Deltaproteobacteria bacterium]